MEHDPTLSDEDIQVVEETTAEKVRFGKRVILVAVAPDNNITVGTFGVGEDLNVEEEVQRRTAKLIETGTKCVCMVVHPIVKTYVVIGKAYKALVGQRKNMQNFQLAFPEGTSLDMLLFLLDLQLRGLCFKNVKVTMTKIDNTPLAEELSFRHYSKPAFYLNADFEISPRKKTSKKSKLDLSEVTGGSKPVKKRFPKKKD